MSEYTPFKMKGFPLQAGVSPMKDNGDDDKWIDRADKKQARFRKKIEKATSKGKTKRVKRLTERKKKHFRKIDARIKAESEAERNE